ncbi:MAG: PilZ domain-containing protein [Deltaproteobacteria bacterium]|nr:PilZ domain-containing protein [Deltaproteobacteria bacterium]
MDIRVCPECGKAFYAAVSSAPLSCAFCACFFEDKRRDKRTRKETGLIFRFMDRNYRARLKDYSENGFRFLYAGKMLKAGSVVEVKIATPPCPPLTRGGLRGGSECAVAVWSKKVSPAVFSSGLKRLGQR